MSEKSREQLQKELDDLTLKDSILKEGKNIWADKWVEKMQIGLVTAILLAFLAAVINLVIK